MEITLEAGAEPVPGYRLVGRLGRGGCGEVWKATGPGGFELALKFVCLAEPVGQPELRAIQIIKDVRHPHLLATFGAWQVGRYLIIAMELAERTLLDRFREAAGQGFPGIPAPEIHEHFLDAARGLDYLNEPRHPSGGTEPVGIQHRDVKPQNLLLVGGSVKVADFGLARILEHTQTSHTGSMTPAYAAPEFFKKQTSSQSDQYSLAVTYCHLRGGRLPFTGGMAEIMAGHLLEPPDLTMLPEGEREAVARALAKEPRDRWGSCRALVDALRSGVPAPDRVAPTTGPVETPTRGTFRPGEAREASSSAECPGSSVSPGRPAPVSSPAQWGARPEVHARRAATAMSDRGRKVLVGSLAGLSLVIVLGLGALGVFALRGRPPGTPGPPPVVPPSDTRPGGPVTSATLVKAEGRATRKGQVVFDGDAPTAPPSQEPQPQRPQPQPRRDWTNSIGIKLVRIEPGSFLMGSTKDQIDKFRRLHPSNAREEFDDEQPQHPVKITRPFFLGIHEVTQGQYQAVMGENPSHFKGSDDLPVEQVSWLDAVLFCNKLSEREKRTPCYRINGTEVTIAGGNGYRLPMEAEWEYACRAGSTTMYPCDDADKLGALAWVYHNSGNETHPVGQKLPNAWGLYDMLGNVWEWCQDWYDIGYYTACKDWYEIGHHKTSPLVEAPGPYLASGYRVIRGGSWNYFPRFCRPAYRDKDTPNYRYYSLGFRVAAVQE